MRVAIIGSGIAGLSCAWKLAAKAEVDLYEAASTPGGHTATVDVELAGESRAIDTGFIVYNDRTYPRFRALLAELGLESQPTEMSFSVRNQRSGLEYNGHSISSLFAQRSNLLKPSFYRFLLEIVRFNRRAKGGCYNPASRRCLMTFCVSTGSASSLHSITFCQWGRLSGPPRWRRCAVCHWPSFSTSLITTVCWI